DTFCRAVDLQQKNSEQDQVNALINELYDPNLGLIEVGIDNYKRVTLTRDELVY
ncbi:MAG: hypothetical protein HQ574_01820, partial [Chloroflexi bacterium]|nr:hypothetical protein [Chloroflexota bacterium]